MPPTSSSASLRLQNLSSQLSPSMAVAATAFPADAVPQAPEDPLFGLMAAYRKDSSPDKVDLGIGAYRDDTAKPWILPVVKQVMALCLYSKYREFRLLRLTYTRPTKSYERTQTSTTSTSPLRVLQISLKHRNGWS